MADLSTTVSSEDRGSTEIVEPYGAQLKEIVVFLDTRAEASGILEFSGELAREHGAHLVGAFIQPVATMTASETFARGAGIEGVIDVHRAQVEGIELKHRALFE
jgi:hypothetical protein